MNVTSDPSPSFVDSVGHGTFVAGVMGARTNNGVNFDSLGVAGVCGGDGRANLGCRLVPIKIAPGHQGPATSFDIARAMLYATRVGARAMNLSYGGLWPSRLERSALYHAITHGCVVVAAAGNWAGLNNGDDPVYPAAYAAEGLCIQAGASDPFDHRAFFSSHGPGLDLLAPGLTIWTTSLTFRNYYGVYYPGYYSPSGTSFAAPHVTGAVGLLAASRPELSDSDFQHVLRESADDIGAPGVDAETGWGRMNAGRALASVRPSFGIWHDEVSADAIRPLTVDSLEIGEGGWGNLDRARHAPLAQLMEATATVALPDSFLDSIRVWPRVGGTTTVRGDFRLPYFTPWARVALDAESFTLRGYFYHLDDCSFCSEPEDADLPLPRDQARFGFTVIGRVDRAPRLEVLAPPPAARIAAGDTLEVRWVARDPDEVTAVELWIEKEGDGASFLQRVAGTETGARIALPCPPLFEGAGTLRVTALDEHGRQHDRTTTSVAIELTSVSCPRRGDREPGPRRTRPWLQTTPNPFRGSTRVMAPPGARLTILDVSGRVVHSASASRATGELEWDGRDDHGRPVRPGIYFVQCGRDKARAQKKVVKLE
jgi:hypothetical protein